MYIAMYIALIVAYVTVLAYMAQKGDPPPDDDAALLAPQLPLGEST